MLLAARLFSTSAGRRAVNTKLLASTLRLPKTTFPPRPSPDKLPRYLQRCTDELYERQSKQRAGEDVPEFVLHDGPPYANGSLHVGHALNKVLKDIICRFELGRGKRVKYVPGWDCHGLPIEMKALQESRSTLSPVEVRKTAEELATRTIEEQKEGFKSWGIMGDWDNAYITKNREYELRQLDVFRNMVERGYIYRQNKPVYWSPSSRTALAEAELEYKDNQQAREAFVMFPITSGLPPAIQAAVSDKVYAVIWTTTIWTIPANRAIAAHEDIDYCVLRVVGPAGPESSNEKSQPRTWDPGFLEDMVGRHLIVAKSRLPYLEEQAGLAYETIVDNIKGKEFLDHAMIYKHPLTGSTHPVITADFVTADSGSGLVHLAPGHGPEDYEVCLKHGIQPFAPVDDHGCYTSEAYPSNPAVLMGSSVLHEGIRTMVDLLTKKKGELLPGEGVQRYLFGTGFWHHRAPIDWRTKKAVIIRATEQWFADVEHIKEAAISAIKDVTFIPQHGKTRLESFIKGRNHWCISRQRAWGVPIPALYRIDNGNRKAVMDGKTIDHIINVIKERGTNAWWSDPEDDAAWVPEGLEGKYVRGRDTMDVWFDSGTSWTSLNARSDEPRADVYLEGSDQHRGWFQSSLLTHTAYQNPSPQVKPPFKSLITHGFVLDEQGRKMSKSLGNVVAPNDIINGILLGPVKNKQRGKRVHVPGKPVQHSYDRLGPDALRLWAASSDYTTDVLIGPLILKGVHQSLHKYRVTFRWLLGVLEDFDPAAMPNGPNSHSLVDTIAQSQLAFAVRQTHMHYASRAPYLAIGAINRYINANLSSFYFETVKDRLYTGTPDERLFAQAVLYEIFSSLMTMLGPVCPLLVEEVWEHTPSSISTLVKHPSEWGWKELLQHGLKTIEQTKEVQDNIPLLTTIHDTIKRAQENIREQKLMGSSLESDVIISIPKRENDALLKLSKGTNLEEQLANMFVVSKVTMMFPDELDIYSKALSSIGEPDGSKPWTITMPFEAPAGFEPGSKEVKTVDGKVLVRQAAKHKCSRCWRYVKEDDEDLCKRCDAVVPEESRAVYRPIMQDVQPGQEGYQGKGEKVE